MHQKKQNLLVSAAVLLSSLIAFYLFDMNYFPNASIAFIFLCLGILVYYVKQEKTAFHRNIFLLILVLCMFLLIRSSPSVTALNIVSIIFLGSILSITSKAEERLINILSSPILVVLQSIRESNTIKLKIVNNTILKTSKSREKTTETIIVTVISLVTFVTISILLGSANSQLGSFFKAALELLKLDGLFNLIGTYLRLERIIIAVVFCVMSLKYLSLVYANTALPKIPTALDRKLDLRTPLVIACALITLFFIFQVDSHFASNDSISKQTNDIFAQLSAVCVVVFALLINNKTRDRSYSIIKTVLYIQLFYLLILASRSDLTYIQEWGLTHKRLYGLVVIIWIIGMYGLYFKYMDRTQLVKNFYEHGIIFTACLLIGVNVLNFDKLIYTYKPSTHVRPVDHVYLAGLSSDSGSHLEHFQELRRIEKTVPNTIAQQDEWSFLTNLQKKYENFDIRIFNLSEYMQYRKIKDTYINPALDVPHILKAE